tara:strand:- start:2133 stop:2522 length:390 start_codon:yes stop_codon:yes gene_type:complete
MSERRQFSRIHFQSACSLNFSKIVAESNLTASLLDISLDGALLTISHETSTLIGEQVEMQLTLDGSDVTLLLNGIVCHQQQALLGIQFTKIDIETMAHLKRLIELNSGDSENMHREFAQLIESHIAASK